jgi:hypothetical protein
MANFDAVAFTAPASSAEIGYETAMAFFGASLGAQQRNSGWPACSVERFRNSANFHQVEKSSFVSRPVPVFAIGLKEFGRGARSGSGKYAIRAIF